MGETQNNSMIEEVSELTENYIATELKACDENHIVFENKENFEFYGDDEQRISMFKDWALYFSEIKNPKNTVMNTFFKTKYAPLGEVLDTIRKPLGKYGLSIIQAPLISNGDPAVKTLVIHKDGGILILPMMSAKAIKNDVQGIVASISYIRRVVVNALAGVIGDQEDDDGNFAAEQQKEDKKKLVTKKESSPLKVELIEICKLKAPIDKEKVVEILSKYGNNDGLVANINDETEIKNAILELNKIKEKR